MMGSANTRTLALLLTIALPGSLFAQQGYLCRWSPDGSHVLFVAHRSDGYFVASHDVATGNVSRLFTAPDKANLCAVAWSPDGKQFAAITREQRNQVHVIAHLMPFPRTEMPRLFRQMDGPNAGTFGPVAWLGSHLWFEADGALQLNTMDGSVRRLEQEPDETLATIGAFGDGIGYVAIKRQSQPEQWEIGRLDPLTLQRTPLYTHETFIDRKIEPRPAFASRFGRIAVPCWSNDEHSILVLENGKILNTLPLAKTNEASIQDLAWSSNSATIYANLHRKSNGEPSQRFLLEASFSGSVSRETRLYESKDEHAYTERHTIAISPDGRTAAVVSPFTLTPLDEPTLYLVNLRDKLRPVTAVAAPPRADIVLCGSELLHELARGWQAAWAKNDTERRLRLVGWGTDAGIASLIAEQADLALMSRPIAPAEHANAQAVGMQLQVHPVVRDAVAICVHPDNPIPAIQAADVKLLFTQRVDKLWSKLGVTISNSPDAIATGMLLPGSAQYMPFRHAVLNNSATSGSHTIIEQPRQLAAFVAQNRNALACLPIDEALRHGKAVRIVPVVVDGARHVSPTEQAIKDGSYPLVETWYVASKTAPMPRVAAFLKWLASDEAHTACESIGHRIAR